MLKGAYATMDTCKRNNIIGTCLLLLTTVVWGSGFVVLKDAIDVLPKFFVIGIRFFVSGFLMFIVFFKKSIKIDKKTLLQGVVLGLVVGGAYVVQTWGLEYTTPARNAFITCTYCVMVPFLTWALKKIKPKSYNVVSAVLCVIGVGFIALSADTADGNMMLLGDALTFISAMFFTVQIVCVELFQNSENGVQLLTVELLTAGVLLFALSAAIELPTRGIGAFKINTDMLFNLCYLTFACTLLAQAGQNYGQKLSSSPSRSSLILSMEAVFGTLFSVIAGKDEPTWWLIIGFAVVFVAIVITVLKLDVAALFKKKKNSDE